MQVVRCCLRDGVHQGDDMWASSRPRRRHGALDGDVAARGSVGVELPPALGGGCGAWMEEGDDGAREGEVADRG